MVTGFERVDRNQHVSRKQQQQQHHRKNGYMRDMITIDNQRKFYDTHAQSNLRDTYPLRNVLHSQYSLCRL